MATEKKTTAKRSVKKKASTAESKPPEKKQYRVKVELDPHMLVTVRNGFAGMLYYRSRRTGEEYTWEQFGDEQDMELGELKNARNSARAFFERNYFLIDDPEVIEYLNAKPYYQNALSVEELDGLFDEDPDDIISIIGGLSEGQKKTLRYRARELTTNGVIDSIKTIEALEQALNIQLIDR